MFGRPGPLDYIGPFWGARAIYTPARWDYPQTFGGHKIRSKPSKISCDIDILGDRQTWSQVNARHPLIEWLNTEGMKALRARLNELCLATSSREVVVVISKDRRFILEASPQGSWGYLYLGAWERPESWEELPILKLGDMIGVDLMEERQGEEL